MDSMTAGSQNCLESRANTTVKVRVHATWDDNLKQVVFGMAGNVDPPGNGEVRGQTIKINPKTGPAEIHFKLKDGTKPDLDLEFRIEEPIQIAPRDHCGDEECPPGSGMAGFEVLECSDTKLKLLNPNSPGDYVYSLWFIDRNGDTHEYDPIIKNRA